MEKELEEELRPDEVESEPGSDAGNQAFIVQYSLKLQNRIQKFQKYFSKILIEFEMFIVFRGFLILALNGTTPYNHLNSSSNSFRK